MENKLIENLRIYSTIMLSTGNIEDKHSKVQNRFTKEEINEIEEIQNKIHENFNKLSIFEFMNVFPQKEN
jgi:archaellum component FlaC